MDLPSSTALATRFDADVGRVRLVALISPTCPVCLRGARIVRESLAAIEGTSVVTHIVWLPVLADDTRDAAREAASEFEIASGNEVTSEVRHYFDEQLAVSSGVKDLLELERRDRRVAWDLYLLYDRATRWSAPVPAPTTWMHQLRIDDVPVLEGRALLEGLRELVVPGAISP